MLRQRLAIAAAVPNLIPTPPAHAPLDRSTRQIAVRPSFRTLENRCSHSSNPHRSQRRNRALSGPRFRALALLGRLSSERVHGVVMQASEKPAHNRTSKHPGSSRRSTPLNFWGRTGCEHYNTTPRFQRRLGVDTHQLADRLVVAGVGRQRTFRDGAQPEEPYAERYERRWSRTSAGAATGPTSWCSRGYLGRPASSRLQLSSLATVSGVDRVTERPAAPFTTRVRALARLRRASGAHQPQKAAPRLPSFPSRHR